MKSFIFFPFEPHVLPISSIFVHQYLKGQYGKDFSLEAFSLWVYIHNKIRRMLKGHCPFMGSALSEYKWVTFQQPSCYRRNQYIALKYSLYTSRNWTRKRNPNQKLLWLPLWGWINWGFSHVIIKLISLAQNVFHYFTISEKN